MSARKGAVGFTLIEVMIVVAVIGILSAIAMPMYQDSMRKSRRSDAMIDLMELASRQERFYAQNGVYTDNIEGEFGLDLKRTKTREGNYDLSVIQCPSDGTPKPIERCYVLQAVPRPGSDQEKDTTCATLSIDAMGQRLSSGTLDKEACW